MVDSLLYTTAGRVVTDATGVPLLPSPNLGIAAPTAPRWADKADAYAAGWKALFSASPSQWGVSLGLAVAQHETFCGDAWPGENNWGGVQLSSLTLVEQHAIQAIVPSNANVPAARAALKAVNLYRDNGALHVDTTPTATGQRTYFVWFAAFPTEAAGAQRFIQVLAGNRPPCKAVLDSAIGAWAANASALATAMYQSHYYEGFHDPHSPGGIQKNIADYAGAILALAPTIYTALALTQWNASPGFPQFDCSSVMGCQSALTFLASKLNDQTLDPMGIDGAMGPHTRSAAAAFQKEVGIAITGNFDLSTQDALRTALSQNGAA